MGKLVSIILLMISLLLPSCRGNDFKVYYIPLGVNFYGVQSPDDVKQAGLMLEMSSSAITDLFRIIDNSNTRKANIPDESVYDYRIIIKRNLDGKVVYITNNKDVISYNNKYYIESRHVDAAIVDIVKHAKLKYKKWRRIDL